MQIIVDADACPVKDVIVKIAKKYNIKVTMVCNTSHIINDNYSEVITVEEYSDSADFMILSLIQKNFILITQDYGLSSIALAKKAIVISPRGFIYTDKNIDRLLFERHISKKQRQRGKYTTKIKKFSLNDKENFEKTLEKIIQKNNFIA